MIAELPRMDSIDHLPVLAEEAVGLLALEPGSRVIDATFGAGGHSRLIASRIGPTGELVAIDRDPEAEHRFDEFATGAPCRTRFVSGDFVSALGELAEEGGTWDAILFDLGVSSMQLDDPDRGFSYSQDGPLDMRMDTGQDLTAAEIVNAWPEDRIAGVLRAFGEEQSAGRIAAAIAARREEKPLSTTAELADVVRKAVPAARRFGVGHPARLTFQALRIAVNSELELLDVALPLAWSLLRKDGRMAVISFHSLEDRRVKRFFGDLARGCICPPGLPVCACGRTPEAELTPRRALKTAPEEVEDNPRGRSARLRGARRLAANKRES
jgi:16S rRNA (cytosine1402-N4)-methyltransferase